ncbi:MAG: HNH endonuclease signature motif containing protein [Acidimicrobiales bacterium]
MVSLSISDTRELRESIERAVGVIRHVIESVVPGVLSGDEAQALVEVLTEAERVVTSGVALLTPRVLETGVYAKAGHASGPDWLAAVAGSSRAAARARLAAAERAAVEPRLNGPLREGKLSTPELQVLSDVATTAPESLSSLLEMAVGESSYRELSDAAIRAKCAARSAESARRRRARVHGARHLNWHQDPHGGIRGEFLCDEVAWARAAPVLEAAAKARWRDSGAGEGESLATHRIDALVNLLAGRHASGDGARLHALVLIDAEALHRGHLEPGDTCEIDGVGPVSLEMATELLGEATTQFVINSGTDVAAVTSSTRLLPQRAAMALIVRDRACVVPGCGKRLGLENDHCDVDYADGGATELSNMARLCPEHHAMKTHGGWKIQRKAGHWKWLQPDKAPSAGRIARTRRVSAAKAKAFRPRRT